MIKPVKCARCRKEPFIWHFQDLDTEENRYAIQHRCATAPKWTEIYAKSVFGAIIRWNIRQWFEGRKMKGEKK